MIQEDFKASLWPLHANTHTCIPVNMCTCTDPTPRCQMSVVGSYNPENLPRARTSMLWRNLVRVEWLFTARLISDFCLASSLGPLSQRKTICGWGRRCISKPMALESSPWDHSLLMAPGFILLTPAFQGPWVPLKILRRSSALERVYLQAQSF